ncbi:MAG: hypothetical protein ACR2KK_06710 [Acidimicrobiales bacterium]
MARLTFDIPDGQLRRVLDAFATAYGHSERVPGPPRPDGTPGPEVANPESSETFARRIIIDFITGVVKGVEANAAAEEARGAAARRVDRDRLVS